jgi:hypothetical protein
LKPSRANHFDKDISRHIEGINSKVLEMTNERKLILTDIQQWLKPIVIILNHYLVVN